MAGAGQVVYAAVLLWVASRPPIDRRLAVMAILLDLGWVAGSALLVVTPWVPFTSAGRWAVIIVADLVAVFAVLQFVGLRRSPAGTHAG